MEEEASSDIAVSPLVSKVFDLELVREMILKYAMFEDSDDGRVCRRRNACTYRLVNKAWLQSTSRILLQLNESLFRFTIHDVWLDANLALNYKLVNFVESVAGNKQLDERVPPFTLFVNYRLLAEINHRRFSNCLTHCGSGLVQLDLQLSADEHACMTLGKNLGLPKLKSLTVGLGLTNSISNGPTDKQVDVIQLIFDASQQLKSFDLSCYNHVEFGSNKLDNLVLPRTLTQLDINCSQNNCKVDVLLKSPPPKMKSLKLSVNSKSFKNGGLTSILETIRKTLETFQVEIPRCTHRSKRPTILPFMEKLKSLQFDTIYLKLEKHLSGLEQLVPNLSHITLTRQTARMFRKWAERSCFESVSSLTVSLLREELDESGLDYRMASFNVETMKILSAAFPNLLRLDISFYAAPLQSVFVIMMGMTKLINLTIYVGASNKIIRGSDQFDALFLGISEDSVAALRKSPELWEEMLNDKKTDSIRNLTELITALPGQNIWGSGSVRTVFGDLMGMNKLKSLKIWVARGEHEVQSSDTYDALFLGIPEDLVTALRNSPELWDDLPEDTKTTSIRNWTDLETLKLNSYGGYTTFSWISDLSFEYAFLKMPRLTTLTLSHSFFASPLIVWK